MNEEQLKQYLKDKLHINADPEDFEQQHGLGKRLVITLSFAGEKLSETKIWI